MQANITFGQNFLLLSRMKEHTHDDEDDVVAWTRLCGNRFRPDSCSCQQAPDPTKSILQQKEVYTNRNT